MDFESTLPLRYYINLGRRQDRRIETEIALEEAGISAERFPAVDARHVRRMRGYESDGRYALALTQRLVLRAAALKGADAVLVMEDDVVFHPELLQRLAEIELPDDWGIFYLGCAHHRRPWPAGRGLVRTPYALDTHAFAVRAPYYRKVMAALSRRANEVSEHPAASDWFLANLHGEIPTYACYPNLAWQAVNPSDLTGQSYSNYTPTGEQVASSGELIGLQAEMWGSKRWRARVERSEPTAARNGSEHVAASLPEIVEPCFAEPKLALLFLTRADVNLPEIWREFVEEAGDGVVVLNHAKDRSAAEGGFLRGAGIDEWHETKWGDISLINAMLALLKAGLRDASVTHFVFLSESCVPVKPWAEICRRLRIDPRPMMRSHDANQMAPKHLQRIAAVRDLPNRTLRNHSQWVLLDRETAECVAEHDFTGHFTDVAAVDEHYFGTVMALRGYPEERIHQQDSTWVKWLENPDRPEEHLKTGLALAAELSAFPGFFARKFPAGSDIGKWGLHRS